MSLDGLCLLGKFICRYYTFLYDFYDDMLQLQNWNQVDWVAWGWTNENFWGSLWSVLCEKRAWVVIDRNRVDREAMCDLFYQVELWSVWMCYVWAPPLDVIKLYHVCEGGILKKKGFSWLKIKVAIPISEWCPIFNYTNVVFKA